MTNTPNYSPPYEVSGNCLYLVAEDKRGQNTKSMRLDGKSRRVVVMDKFNAQVTIDGVCENLV